MTRTSRLAARLLALACGGMLIGGAYAYPPNVGCPWVPEAININTHNFGYPDAAANYSVAVLPNSPTSDTTITIHGQYPMARYFSFQAADGFQLGNLVDQIADSDLVSDSGLPASGDSTLLPAADYNGYDDTYTVTVKFQAPPSDPSQREPNTLYAGAGQTGLTKTVVMRVYLPNPDQDMFGGVPLPELTYHGPRGDINLNDTPDQALCGAMDWFWTQVHYLYIPASGSANVHFAPVTLGGNVGGLYPNGDSTYLRATGSLAYGKMVVVRAKAPSFPPLPPLAPGAPQVRYWSLCQNELKNTVGVACIADRDMVLQDDGTFTAVISPDNVKPAKATAEYGYNWLPWGSAPDNFVAIRQILAEPDFAGNFQKAIDAPLQPVSTTLGEWAPDITYCDPAVFDAYAEQGGAAVMAACRSGGAGTAARRLAARR